MLIVVEYLTILFCVIYMFQIQVTFSRPSLPLNSVKVVVEQAMNVVKPITGFMLIFRKIFRLVQTLNEAMA